MREYQYNCGKTDRTPVSKTSIFILAILTLTTIIVAGGVGSIKSIRTSEHLHKADGVAVVKDSVKISK